MARGTNLKPGDRVRVRKIRPLETHHPDMPEFIGKEGVVIKRLPREWKDRFKYPRVRIMFDDKSLTYTDATGVQHNAVLNFFTNEVEKFP